MLASGALDVVRMESPTADPLGASTMSRSLHGRPPPAMRRSLAFVDGFGVVMTLAFGLGAVPVFLGVLNHDVAWYLHLAGRVLAGDRLYVDVIETNPPLIVWLSIVPRFVAESLGVSDILTLRVSVLALIGGSLLLTGRVLLSGLPDRPGARRLRLLLALFILLLLPGYDFAQREHLMLALVLPYLVTASGRATGREPGVKLAWVVGLAAGVGLALKPHFVLPWLAVEAWLAAIGRGRRTWARPEVLAVVGVGVAYAAAVMAITPDYLRLMAGFGPVYAASGRSAWLDSLGQPATVVAALAVLGMAATRRPGDPGRRSLGPILAAVLGFLAVSVLQGKGYSYHYYPPLALAVLLVGLIALGGSRSPARGAGLAEVLMVATLASLVLLVAVAQFGDSAACRGRPGRLNTPLGRMIRVVNQEAGGGPIFVFSPAVPAGFPLVTYGRVGLSSRHPALWFLPAFHPRGFTGHSGRIEAMGEVERFLFDSVVDELLAGEPTLLFVDETERSRAFEGGCFRYLDYYALDPRFAGFLREYEPWTKVDDFRVYRRKSGSRLRRTAG